MLEKLKQNYLLVLIIGTAAVMRLYGYSSWSLTNDELSAITRLRYDSLSDLLANGVRPDMHPAGVQVFLYYWIKLFGDSAASIRLPFVIAGIFSTWFIYLIGKQWFGKKTGLIAAMALSVLSYPILYSQLARPYSMGLCFSLGMVWSWNQLLFEANLPKTLSAIRYCLFTALSMYTHYFSFLFAIIVGTTGLLFLKKENFKPYLLGALGAVLLFLPHLSISLEQFGRGGVGGEGGWLGPPGKNYLWKYLSYCFNDSSITIVLCGLFLLTILFIVKRAAWNKFIAISLLWFAVPFAIGYYYSIHVNPVLQYSVLIFSFPFLLLFIFSFADSLPDKIFPVVLAALGITGIAGTVFEKDLYHSKEFGVFKELAELTKEWDDKYESKNITRSYNLITEKYIDYYFAKMEYRPSYSFFRGDEVKNYRKLYREVQNCKTLFFLYAWSNNYNPQEAQEIIKLRYPEVWEQKLFFNSGITLYAKGNGQRTPVFYSKLDFAGVSDKQNWAVDSMHIIPAQTPRVYNSICFIMGGSCPYFNMSPETEYACTFTKKVRDVFKDSVPYVNISAHCRFQKGEKAHLVVQFNTAKDSLLDWASAKTENFIDSSGVADIFITRKMPKAAKPDDVLKIYFWNPDKSHFYIDQISVDVYEDSKRDY